MGAVFNSRAGTSMRDLLKHKDLPSKNSGLCFVPPRCFNNGLFPLSEYKTICTALLFPCICLIVMQYLMRVEIKKKKYKPNGHGSYFSETQRLNRSKNYVFKLI